jgi:hypothetical protein
MPSMPSMTSRLLRTSTSRPNKAPPQTKPPLSGWGQRRISVLEGERSCGPARSLGRRHAVGPLSAVQR